MNFQSPRLFQKPIVQHRVNHTKVGCEVDGSCIAYLRGALKSITSVLECQVLVDVPLSTVVPSTDILDTGQRQWTNPVQGLCVAIYSLATFGTFGKIWMLRCCLNVVDDDDDDVMWRRVVTPCTTACQVLAPLPIGFAVFLVHLATIPITGTGINPARSLGAAVIYNTHHNAWNDHVSFLSNWSDRTWLITWVLTLMPCSLALSSFSSM